MRFKQAIIGILTVCIAGMNIPVAAVSAEDEIRSAFERIESEDFDSATDRVHSASGYGTGVCIGWIADDHYIKYNSIDFGNGAKSAIISAASCYYDSELEIHLDSVDGEMIGSCFIPNVNDWYDFTEYACPVTNVSGVHDVYLVCKTEVPDIDVINLDYFTFSDNTEYLDSILKVELNVDNIIVRSGSNLKIYVDIKGEIPDDAWITLVPSDVPHTEKDSDANNGDWARLNTVENGEIVLKAPNDIGNYDIRVFDSDYSDSAKEVACLPIILEYAPDLEVNISVDGITVKAGADLDIKTDIKGYIPSDAWITFVPSDIPHTEKDGDDHNGDYMRLKDIENGVATIKTPSKLGKYDIRVYNGDDERLASEIAYLTIYLSYAPDLSVALSADNTQVKPSENMDINVDITGEIPSDAWITFVPSDIPHTEKDGDEHNGDWKRLKDIENGVVTLKTPDKTGKYDVRVYNGDGENAEEIACLPVLITDSPSVSAGTTKGDLNSDGVFNIADAVILQKWLLSGSEINPVSWKNGDFIADNELDVFDLCAMKYSLVNADT